MAVSFSLLAGAGWQFFDDNGNPLSGGLLYTYEAGTTTPQTTYTDSNGNVANSNPIVLDAAGRVPYQVWLTAQASYKFILKTSTGVTVWSEDDVPGYGSSADIIFLQAGTGAVARTVQSKLRDTVSVLDFGADPTGATSSTAAIQAALTAGAGKAVYFPAGSYSINAALSVPANTYVYGQSGTATVTQATGAGTDAFSLAGDGITIDGLKIVGPNSGAGSAVRADSRNNPTIKNCQVQNWLYGIQLRGCKNSTVTGNKMWGGTYNASSASDIIIFGSAAAPSNRTIITNNFCLSNTDNGIFVDTNSGDRETIIQGNVVVTCSDNGVDERADGSNYRRNGIIVGYNGGTNSRAVISGNIVRNAPYAGIYTQGAALPAGDVVISGNLVSRCGWGTAYPTDASIRAGILIASGGQDSISGNTIIDCSTAGIKYAPDFARNLTNGHRPVIASNMISRTTGIGIFMTNRPFGVQVCANRIINSTAESIYFQTTNNPSDIGNVLIDGNHIDTTSTSGAILFDAVYSTTYANKVSNNQILGSDNTTVSAFNSGVYARGNVQICGNTITKFYRGVMFNESGTTLDFSWMCANNFIVDCYYGIDGGQGTGTRVAQGNQFRANTTQVVNCWEGQIVSNRLLINGVAPPTNGSWGQGDHMQNASPAVGQPKGWFCTVAGTPGTWVSEGNL